MAATFDFKRLNLYIPKGKKINDEFISDVEECLPLDIKVHKVENSEVASLNELGFTLDPLFKLSLTKVFIEKLEDA